MSIDSENSDDEWFFDSIKRYEDLLIYEFQGTINCSWFHKEDTLLVACQRSTSFELLELAIPDRFSNDESIIKNRDFKVLSAGYTLSNVSSLCSHDQYAITSEAKGVTLYKLGNADSDLITFNSSVRQEISHPLSCFHSQDNEINVVSGTHYSNIQCYNLHTEKMSTLQLNFKKNQNLIDRRFSYLNTSSNNIYCGFQEMGQLISYDYRCGDPCFATNLDNVISDHWFYSVSKSCSKVSICNYLGNVTVFDVRNVSKVYFDASIEFSYDCMNNRKAKVNFDSTENYLSISGFDKSVFVYLMNTSDADNLKFVHDGHKKKANYLSDHLWHPTIKNVVFSTDDIGVLQAWKFV